MCLNFNDSDIKKTKVLRATGGKVIRFKMIKRCDGKFVSPYMYNVIKSNVLKSNRRSKSLSSQESGDKQVHRGIHVYTDLNTAQSNAVYDINRKIVRVECDLKDLVMTSSYADEEVYMKVKFLNLFPEKTQKVQVQVKKEEKSMVKWQNVLAVDQTINSVQDFAVGNISKDQFLRNFSGTNVYPELRKLVRERGANGVRTLARRALRRRGVSV
jgi:hypothetical protein